MQKAIIYCRKSTDNQKDQQQSLDIQLDWATNFCENNKDIQVVETIIEAKSAFKIEWREWFARLVDIFEKWLADTLIVYQIDRICRNPLDEGNIKWLTQQGKIKKIISAQWEFDWRQILTLSLFMAMANQYSIDHSFRVQKWKQEKVESWEISWRATLWYFNDKNDEWKAKPSEDAKYIKRIFEMRCDKCSLELIREQITDEWFRTKKWKKISRTVIERILKNPFYYWMIVYRWEFFKWNHEPLISKEIFDKVNSLGRWAYIIKDKKISPLKWLVFDFRDNTPLVASLVKKKYIYFHTHSRKKDKPKIHFNQSEIIKYFDKNIHLYCVPEEFKKQLNDSIYEEYEKEISENKEAKKELRRKITNLENEIDFLWKMRRNQEITSEEYLRDKNKLMNEKEDLLNNLIRLDRNYDKILNSSNDLVKLLVELDKIRENLSEENKLEIISNIVVKLFVDEQKRLYIEEEPLFKAFRLWNCNDWWIERGSNPRPCP